MNRRQIAHHILERMQIVYYCAQGISNRKLGPQLGCHENTVAKWRKRWQVCYKDLEAFEQAYYRGDIKESELKEKLFEVLSDHPRSGAPSRISEAEKNRLTALACESPDVYGLPFTRWTHAGLSEQAKKKGIQVSPAHLGRILKKRFTSA